MVQKIEPISGFPEYTPAQQLAFGRIVATIQGVYSRFGYTPLETPAVERIDTLVSKGIDSKEVYALRRLNVQGDDDGAKELALRFDLTVPTARYVAQHYPTLVFPFRRQQTQPVWRGERPKAGRYRQFYQCDIDYIADGELPLAADAEIIACAFTALKELGLRFTMRVNNRTVLHDMLSACGFAADTHTAAIAVIDDMEKRPRDAIAADLAALGGDATGLLNMLANAAALPATQGVTDARRVLSLIERMIGAEAMASVVFDPTIARGLNYYTGTVVETVLHEAPELGSICSGGRYENLAEGLSGRHLPGVGISIGLSRLASWMMAQNGPFAPAAASPAQVFVAHADGFDAAPVVAALRARGVAVEQSFDALPVAKQLMNADKRGLRYGIVGVDGPLVQLRVFATRTTEALTLDAVIARVRA